MRRRGPFGPLLAQIVLDKMDPTGRLGKLFFIHLGLINEKYKPCVKDVKRPEI